MNSFELILLFIAILVLSHQSLGDENSPTELISNACKTASNVEACKSIVKSIVEKNAGQSPLNANNVASSTTIALEHRYRDIAKIIDHLIQENKDAKTKEALSQCSKIYLDMAEKTWVSSRDLYKGMLCKARDSVSSGKEMIMSCEDGLVKAGTAGEKLGLYKDINDFENLVGACVSTIGYKIESNNVKCKTN